MMMYAGRFIFPKLMSHLPISVEPQKQIDRIPYLLTGLHVIGKETASRAIPRFVEMARQHNHCLFRSRRHGVLGVVTFADVLITFGMGAQLLGTDYGMYGVLVIVFMFYLRGRKPLLCICYFAGTLACFRLVSLFEIVSVIAFIIIFGYNGEKGPDDKKLYYLFYPCHLIILALITGAVYGWQVFT